MSTSDPQPLSPSPTPRSRAENRQIFQAGLTRSIVHWAHEIRGHPSTSAIPPTTLNHAQKCLYRALEFGADPDLSTDLLVALHLPMMHAGHWRVWEGLLREFIQAMPPARQPRYRFEPRYFLAEICFRTAQLDDALALTLENLGMAETLADTVWASALHDALAEIHINRTRFDLAEHHARLAVDLALPLADPRKQADALINLGRAHLGNQRPDLAQPVLAQALTISQTAGDQAFAVKAHIFLGHSLGVADEWEPALAQFEAALTGVTSYGDRVGEGVVRVNLGRALLRLGRLGEAEIQISAGLHIHQAAHNQPSIATAQDLLAELAGLRATTLSTQQFGLTVDANGWQKGADRHYLCRRIMQTEKQHADSRQNATTQH